MPLREYHALLEKVEHSSQELFKKSAEQINCKIGCASCCADDLSVLLVEAYAIQTFIAEEQERDPSFSIKTHPKGACAFLNEDQQCQIYSARPILCRTHGLALKMPDRQKTKENPDNIYYCELNFKNEKPKEEQILDSHLVQNLLTVVHERFKQYVDEDDAVHERIKLRDLCL